MGILIHKPGLLSSFQDLGRFGFQYLGVSVTGAMDALAHQMANRIVGNRTDLATLEMTLIGPQLTFTVPCCIALSGADMQATLDGLPMALNRPYIARRGQTLKLMSFVTGARTYLAVMGGFALDTVMNSQSTYLRSGLGGWQGRALKKDDEIPLQTPLPDNETLLKKIEVACWQVQLYLPLALQLPNLNRESVRVIASDQWPAFTADSLDHFLSNPWRISRDSERMGYRLEGPKLALSQPKQMLSEVTSFGTIQVPVDGQPIILMADRQSTGGYPKIATVAQVDLPILAQRKPGDAVRFKLIDMAEAQKLDQLRQAAIDHLAQPLEPIFKTFRPTFN
jgi:antagonist of KipI